MEKLTHHEFSLIEYALDNHIRNNFKGQGLIDIKALEQEIVRRAEILRKLSQYIEEPK